MESSDPAGTTARWPSRLKPARNEWRGATGDEPLDAWQRCDKSGGHFAPLELGGSQDEGPSFRRFNGRSFGDSIANAIVFREHDPASLADFAKPIFVFGVGSKMVVVNLDGFADLPQRLSVDIPAEGTVDEKD